METYADGGFEATAPSSTLAASKAVGPGCLRLRKACLTRTQEWWPKVMMPNLEGYASGLSVTGFSRTSSCLLASCTAPLTALVAIEPRILLISPTPP